MKMVSVSKYNSMGTTTTMKPILLLLLLLSSLLLLGWIPKAESVVDFNWLVPKTSRMQEKRTRRILWHKNRKPFGPSSSLPSDLYSTTLPISTQISVARQQQQSKAGNRRQDSGETTSKTDAVLEDASETSYNRNSNNIGRQTRNVRRRKHLDPLSSLSLPFPSRLSLPLSHQLLARFLSSPPPKVAIYLVLACAGWSVGRSIVSSEAVQRAWTFWVKAGPMVAHYKFTQWWLTATTTTKPSATTTSMTLSSNVNTTADYTQVTAAEGRAKRDAVYGTLHRRYAQPAYELILELQGLYVKLGQVLSSRPDFLPKEYVKLFSLVQDQIPQWPVENVKAIITESFQNELGANGIASFEDVFESIDSMALGSASIGQVHRAVLKPGWENYYGLNKHLDESIKSHNGRNHAKHHPRYTGGREVAVKVMHPGAQDRFRNDFQVFRWLCRIALPGWRQILDELERRMMNEFDYRNEALSLEEVRRNLLRQLSSSSPPSPLSSFFSKNKPKIPIRIPQPHTSLCCKHVLVMELLHGIKLTDAVEQELASALGGDHKTATAFLEARQRELMTGVEEDSEFLIAAVSPWTTKVKLLRLQRKFKKYIDLLVDIHGYQIFVDGCFNGDCHPGNILVLKGNNNNDGGIGLIDYGQTKRLSDLDRLAFAKVVVALSHDNGHHIFNSATDADVREVATAFLEAGFSARNNSDTSCLSQYAALFFDSDEEGVNQGFPNPQLYFAHLTSTNPLLKIPDPAIFVARASFLFRGMGHALGGGQIRTSKRWAKYAGEALEQAAMEKVTE